MRKTLRETSIEPPLEETVKMEPESEEGSSFSRALRDESSTIVSEETAVTLAEFALDQAIEGKSTDCVKTFMNSADAVRDLGWRNAMEIAIENWFGIAAPEVPSETVVEIAPEPLAVEEFEASDDDVEDVFSAVEPLAVEEFEASDDDVEDVFSAVEPLAVEEFEASDDDVEDVFSAVEPLAVEEFEASDDDVEDVFSAVEPLAIEREDVEHASPDGGGDGGDGGE